MPAELAHHIFAEDALRSSLGAEGELLLSGFGPAVALGAQGPDIFYHNRRTMPSGLSFGKLLHRHGYGTAVRAMVAYARQRYGGAASDTLTGAYTLSFVTHAFLDRGTHPFIIYFSGWVDPKRPETANYALCHAFFERILDALVLGRKRDGDLLSYGFHRKVDCGPEIPGELAEALFRGLAAISGRIGPLPISLKRIGNAYLDALNFYRFTDPADSGLREAAKRFGGEAGNGFTRVSAS